MQNIEGRYFAYIPETNCLFAMQHKEENSTQYEFFQSISQSIGNMNKLKTNYEAHRHLIWSKEEDDILRKTLTTKLTQEATLLNSLNIWHLLQRYKTKEEILSRSNYLKLGANNKIIQIINILEQIAKRKQNVYQYYEQKFIPLS